MGECHVTNWNFPSEHRTDSRSYLHQESNIQGITDLLIPRGSFLPAGRVAPVVVGILVRVCSGPAVVLAE